MEPQKPMETPNVTTMQKLVAAGAAVVVAGIALVNALNIYDVSAEASGAIIGFYTALGSFFVISDAIIRNGRSRAYINPPKPPTEQDKLSA